MWCDKTFFILCCLETYISFSNAQKYGGKNTAFLKQSLLATPKAELTVACLIKYRNDAMPIEDAMSKSDLVRLAVKAVGGVRTIKETIVANEPDISARMLTVATYADILCQFCIQQQIQWCINQWCNNG